MKKIMIKINLILIYFLLFFSIANAEIVKEIKIEGNKRVSDETIKVYGDIKPIGSDFSNADLDKILKNLYSTDFLKM